MAVSNLLALIDDIATLLDDVAAMSKVAAQKTAGVLGDDLALNAQQVTGLKAERELPVVWAVAKGSLRNKLILVPAALAISALAPWAITPLLMAGGAYLCFEGFEKIAHRFLPDRANDEAHHRAQVAAVSNSTVDLVAFERDKIAGAIRTDFVLSAEIVVISLGIAAAAPFGQQVAVLSAIALLMTVGVYGAVAAIVKLDDAGLFLSALPGERVTRRMLRALGRAILRAAPWLMKSLSIVGTAAMFLVGGGIIAHGWPLLHHASDAITEIAAQVPDLGALLAWLAPITFNAVIGVLVGALVLLITTLGLRLRSRLTQA